MDVSELAGRLRRPEYTGENRCVPCTVVNVGLAAVGALVVGVLATPVVGLLALAAAGCVIYFRGYLVPGTPTLTERYFPPWLLELFGKEPIVTTDAAATGDTGRPLVDAGVLAATDGAPTLTQAFAGTWHDRTTALADAGVDSVAVARAFDAETVSELGEASFVVDGDTSLRWGSTAALAADLAAVELLDERLDDWAGYDRDRRRATLRALRLCLERCPACGDDLAVETERVDPCCQKPHLVAESVCDACGAAVADAAVVDADDVDSVPAALLDR